MILIGWYIISYINPTMIAVREGARGATARPFWCCRTVPVHNLRGSSRCDLWHGTHALLARPGSLFAFFNNLILEAFLFAIEGCQSFEPVPAGTNTAVAHRRFEGDPQGFLETLQPAAPLLKAGAPRKMMKNASKSTQMFQFTGTINGFVWK